ncbi:serine/threonine protein phosphatase [Bacillus sp. LL01]|uniref:metallophosphoesterase family protein n=1 Tax=Bacillus sp. LL01 TaxID=1665556 RepID=UPI00064CEDB3|nr:metallophosphoesterase family protein [Bacillus sp. LL01]KMJ57679.1 serine/threonine protein phosphatase [Bacillus sp. LL01]
MKRMLAISDIHGDLDKFERLLEIIQYDKNQDQLLLLGDYVDRGPKSRAVLDKVIKLTAEGAITLIGNHDKMMIDAFDNTEDPLHLKRWYYNGGIKTLQNYGYDIEKDDAKYWYSTDEMPEPLAINEQIRPHLEFLKTLPFYYETDTHIFVHAGVHPDTTLEVTDPHTLVWIREEFHKGYTGEKTVVFGHTPTKNLHKKEEVYIGENNIIGIDGGCAYGGRLYCFEALEAKVYYAE